MAKSSKKLKIGHVQDTPVSTSMISNECMICHMKVHIVSYNLDQKNFSKSKIHILPNYEQTNLKMAIVYEGERSILFYLTTAASVFAKYESSVTELANEH